MDKDLKDYLEAKFESVQERQDKMHGINSEQHKSIIQRLDITNGNITELDRWRGGAEVEIAKNCVHRQNVQKYWKWGFLIVILIIILFDAIGLDRLISLIK